MNKKAERLRGAALAGLLLAVCGSGYGAGARETGEAGAYQLKGEIVLAEERVVGARKQVKLCRDGLKTASRQVEAAKALLKASEADLKAALAEREALELKSRANGLAQAAGLKMALRSQAGAGKKESMEVWPAEPDPVARPSIESGEELVRTRIKPVDFASQEMPARVPLR